MKHILLCVLLGLFTIGISAQSPQGMGGGGRPGGPPPQHGGQHSIRTEDKIVLEVFPEIPDLTLKQRERVGTILTKEMKDIHAQMDKKRVIEMTQNPYQSEKEIEKQRKKLDKIEKKINDIKDKSDKKIRKELTPQQYIIFSQKRSEFKFKREKGIPQQYRDRMGEPPSRDQMPDRSLE